MAALGWFLFSCTNAHAASDQILSYTAPKVVKGSVIVEYPPVEELYGKEAWVDLSFMVSETGQPFDIEVTDSSGAKAFIKQAVQALEKGLYSPAMQNGVPIEASQEMRVRFQIQGSLKAAYPKFVRRFRSLMNALKRNDVDKASRIMAKLDTMDIRNLYEDAYLNIARFNYAVATDQPDVTQLRFLSRAVDGQGQEGYLPSKLYLGSMELKFNLEVQTKDYVSALHTYRRMTKLDESGGLEAKYQQLHTQILALKSTPGSYQVVGELAESGIWRFDLFKMRFSLHDVRGEISDLKLKCSARRVSLPVRVDAEFKIPASYGACALVVSGAEGTQFKVLQTTL
ncbi:hypothetical protein GCM10008090_15470 [Arenicella chitinivorans]|uniref:TonB C-terminal domain-containing protein n=2 Tax=Arenicella chitinivorans TaxID=1329800 RepID=A0A918VLY8_9GAMM|nr:hypothetical protein GCM10008090_15470 [Arenicella chitinivorans]